MCVGRVSGGVCSGNAEGGQKLVYRLPSIEPGEGKVLGDGDRRTPQAISHTVPLEDA